MPTIYDIYSELAAIRSEIKDLKVEHGRLKKVNETLIEMLSNLMDFMDKYGLSNTDLSKK